MFQHDAEAFVLVDRRVGDTLVLVEDGVGDRYTFSADFKAAVREGVRVHVFAL
jgi:hypothetical protein